MIHANKSILALRNDKGELPAYAWPGGYPMFYIDGEDLTVCPSCANIAWADGLPLTDYDANWEDPHMYCDHCGKRIESAYAEDEVEQS